MWKVVNNSIGSIPIGAISGLSCFCDLFSLLWKVVNNSIGSIPIGAISGLSCFCDLFSYLTCIKSKQAGTPANVDGPRPV